MANAFLNAQEYANTMLLLVKNELVMGRLVNSKFNSQVTDENGLTISQKRPPRFVAKDGAALQRQDIKVGRADISVDTYKNVHVGVGDIEYVQSYSQLMQNSTMKSAASALAIAIDQHLHDQTLKFSNWVGTPGNVIGSPQQFNAAPQRLDLLGVPMTDRGAAVYTDDAYGITNTLIDSNSLTDVAQSALMRSRIPMLANIQAQSTQMSKSVATGSRPVTGALVAGASQNVDYNTVKNTMTQTLNIDNAGSGVTFSEGDVFTIDGVFAVNPRTAEAYPYLQQFTVTAAATADGSGTAALTITPAIVVPGTDVSADGGTNADANTAFATVSAAPADNAPVTFLGAPGTIFRFSSAFHKDAISLVFAKLHKPFTGVSSFASDPDSGVSIRYWRGSDINTGEHIHRWDCIFGAEAMDPLLGTRVSGS